MLWNERMTAGHHSGATPISPAVQDHVMRGHSIIIHRNSVCVCVCLNRCGRALLADLHFSFLFCINEITEKRLLIHICLSELHEMSK